jgi:hypothetical protein
MVVPPGTRTRSGDKVSPRVRDTEQQCATLGRPRACFFSNEPYFGIVRMRPRGPSIIIEEKDLP